MKTRRKPTRHGKIRAKPVQRKRAGDIEQERFESAVWDRLTRTYNKSYLLDRIKSELAYAKRHQVCLALILFDMDDFKKINKLYGRAAGDYALQKVSATLHRSTRDEDVVARVDDDAFAVLVRDANNEKVMVLTERLCRGIAQTGIVFKGRSFAVTASTGISLLAQHTGSLMQTSEDMLNSAVKSLEQIKNMRVVRIGC